MLASRPVLLLCLVLPISLATSESPKIWDVWQTTWDKTKLFSRIEMAAPIIFGPITDSIASANIVVDDTVEYQQIVGFGGSLTDSAALTLNDLKSKNPNNYWHILGYMFSQVDGVDAAGLNYIRVPIGASDFSAEPYSLDDTDGDTSLLHFDINRIPSYVFSVLDDIKQINNHTRLHLVPWSPPGWMKDGGSMNGGSLKEEYIETYANYLLKAVQGFRDKRYLVHAISIQNEPQNPNPTYPTCSMSPDTEGKIGRHLSKLFDANGLSHFIRIVGYEHNWNNAGSYPVQLMKEYGDAFSGVAFHCYQGDISGQDVFHSDVPLKAIYFTECAGLNGSDWWEDIKWLMDNLWIGSLERHSGTGLMWNIALDGKGNPLLPGTDSCGGTGCRPLVTINNDGSFSFDQEFYSMAHVSKATIPKDAIGPSGKRIKVTVTGSKPWALRVSAYVTHRAGANEWWRYSLVVLNWDDSASTNWNPQPVTATIEFRGLQATYTFPVGITTLWWFAQGRSKVA